MNRVDNETRVLEWATLANSILATNPSRIDELLILSDIIYTTPRSGYPGCAAELLQFRSQHSSVLNRVPDEEGLTEARREGSLWFSDTNLYKERR